MTAPLRITERADYALRSVLLLSGHDGEYLTAKAVAEHFGMSTKMLASVLWNLRAAGILESRPGWHGGFRLACPPENIPVSAVIAAARGEDAAAPATHRSQPRPNSRRRCPRGARETWWTASGAPWTITSRAFWIPSPWPTWPGPGPCPDGAGPRRSPAPRLTTPTVELVGTDDAADAAPAPGPVPADPSGGLAPRTPPPSTTASDLARRFAEQLVGDALVAGRVRQPSVADPAVDWPAIWAAGEGVDSPERAAGRIVLAAGRMAQILAGESELLDRDAAPPAYPFTAAPAPALTEVPVPSPAPPTLTFPTPQLASSPPPPPPPVPAPASVSVEAPTTTPTSVPLITSTPDEPAAPMTSAGTPGAPRHARRRRLFTVFSWVGTIGAIVVLFAAWQLWGTGLVHHHDQQRLAGQFRALVALNTAAVGHASLGLLPGDRDEAVPRAGTVTARLQIPAIGLDQYVVEGTSTGDLEQGPGHATGTAVPGQAGNVVLAGHRSTFGAPFGRLGELRPGESVIVTTTLGQRLTYLVSAGPTFVTPGDTAILDNFGDDRLTLSTSDPRYSAARRLVVVARLHEPTAASSTGPLATHPVGGPPGRLAASDTAGWNLSHLPLVLVLVAALVLLAVLYRGGARRLGRLGTVLVFVPLWAAGIYFLFQLLTDLLPATI